MNSKKIEGFENYTIFENSDIWSNNKKGFMKQSLDTVGRYRVRLYKDGKGYTKKISRLLGIAFIPNPENKPCIDHIDRNPSNDNLNNLRWATIKENNNNKGVFKGCITISKDKRGDKVYESIQFSWYVNGKHKGKSFKTIKDAEIYQLFRLCFYKWREIIKK